MAKKQNDIEKDLNLPRGNSNFFSLLNSVSPLGWSNASLLVSSIALFALVKNDFYKSPNLDPFLEFIRGITPVAVLIIIIEKFSLSQKILKPESPAHRRFWSQIRFALSVIVLALILLPIIYQSGFPNKVSEFLSTQIPFLGLTVVKTITQIATILTSLTTSGFGNILLGIIGNIIYDLFKKVFARNKENSKAEKS